MEVFLLFLSVSFIAIGLWFKLDRDLFLSGFEKKKLSDPIKYKNSISKVLILYGVLLFIINLLCFIDIYKCKNLYSMIILLFFSIHMYIIERIYLYHGTFLEK